MRIRVLELCSYGETADFEAIDFDGATLDLNHIPQNWEPKGGDDEARKFIKENLAIEVYIEGRIIGFDFNNKDGKEKLKKLLEEWPRM